MDVSNPRLCRTQFLVLIVLLFFKPNLAQAIIFIKYTCNDLHTIRRLQMIHSKTLYWRTGVCVTMQDPVRFPCLMAWSDVLDMSNLREVQLFPGYPGLRDNGVRLYFTFLVDLSHSLVTLINGIVTSTLLFNI